MGLRGPKPKTNVRVLDPAVSKRPRPIPGMTRYARNIWKKIVNSHNPDYFKPQNLEQLRIYCEAASSEKKATLEIKKSSEVIVQTNGVVKKNPWIDVRVQMASIVSSLGTKLQIHVNSTAASKTKDGPGQSEKPKSARAGLLGGVE